MNNNDKNNQTQNSNDRNSNDEHDINSNEEQQIRPQAAIEDWSVQQLSRANYNELGGPQEVEQRFLKHLLSSQTCRQSLRHLLLSKSTISRDYSLEIDTFDLLESDPVLGHLLLKFPVILSGLLEKAIVSAQQKLEQEIIVVLRQENSEEEGGGDAVIVPIVKGTNNSRVHARLIHLPPTCCKLSLASLAAEDVGKIVQCSGTVVRVTPVCMYESCRRFKCKGKQGCGKEFMVHADLAQRHNALMAPERCGAEGGHNCNGRHFQPTENGAVHTDYQEVTIQETASRLGGAHVPRSLLVKLEHDLVDRCQPGDEVVIVGVLLSQWHQSVMVDVDSPVGMALHAHSIRVIQDKSASAWASSGNGESSLGADMDEDKFRSEFTAFWEDPKNIANPIAARDYICKAVCPKLYGMAIVKLGLLITLIGGGCRQDGNGSSEKAADRKDDDDDDEPEPFQMIQNKPASLPSMHYTGEDRNPTDKKWKGYGETVQTRRRGQSHLLLVGDPGTGKSQFLRFAAAICPRSVLTTGVGTTSAGLTCAAVRGNGKEFSLEAGALVLADQGVCCIDEFGCIQDQDRTTIHEAMEQQTLSVAKAGIVCKLNCRATIIAVMNPRDCLYDNDASLSRNTGLGTPLLSRFDLIFKMMDSSDAERDSNVTTYLLNRAIQGAGLDTEKEKEPMDTPWTMEKLRAYISVVRERFQPAMSDDAASILEAHYEKCRSSQSSTIPVTVRFLESLIRLSQAHARLMFRNQVTLDDAVAVIRIMECSAFAYAGFSPNVDDFDDVLYCDPMTIDFSRQADLDFLCFKAQLLRRYGMQHRLSLEEHSAVSEAVGVGTFSTPSIDDFSTGRGSGSGNGGPTYDDGSLHFNSNTWSALEQRHNVRTGPSHDPKRRRM